MSVLDYCSYALSMIVERELTSPRRLYLHVPSVQHHRSSQEPIPYASLVLIKRCYDTHTQPEADAAPPPIQGTFVGQHALESLPLLHAVLALAAINQQPLSVETRAESLLYFEASVDLYVRSLQQEDDISLFTLLLLSLYYAFDSGTSQSQHFSRRAQSIINDRFELLGAEYLKAYPDFRFLVRLHVWYEVLANLACRPGELRDMAPGKYTLPYLIGIIEQWDAQEEKNAGLSGVNPDYSMLGLLGVPTFFIRLLCEITFLKEEQAALLGIDAENLDENGQQVKRALFAKHARKIRDLVSLRHCHASCAFD